MRDKNIYQLMNLMQEQAIKRKAFNRQVQLEMLNLNELVSEKLLRQEYIRFLADRLIRVDIEIDQIVSEIPVDLGPLVS